MRRLSAAALKQIFNPSYHLQGQAGMINQRWMRRQSFVLSIGASILTCFTFPLFHVVASGQNETAFVGHWHRISVLAVAALCLLLPLTFKRLRKYTEYFSFANLLVLFLCVSIDVALSEKQRRYTAVGLIPLFGSTFVFTDVRVMSVAYSFSYFAFATLNIWRHRSVEIIVVYGLAYFIAWWMAMIRIRSLHRISFDQAKLFGRQVYDQRVRFARDLHDSLGGDLMQLSLQIDGNAPREKMLDLAYAVIAKTKNLVYALEPRNENQNFGEFVRAYVQRLEFAGKFKVHLAIDAAWPAQRIDHSLNLQAIFTEWMTNTIRHSKATKIDITVRNRGESFVLYVRDNGGGFRWSGEKIGSGLRNIALRAELMNAKAFARRITRSGGTGFYLKGKLRFNEDTVG